MTNPTDPNGRTAGGPDGVESADTPVDGAATPESVAGAPSDLAAQLKTAEDEAARLKDAWLRAKAETDNLRKQAQNDVTKATRYAVERFAQDLLEVKDALENALGSGGATPETLRSGVELTLKNLQTAFERAQISEISPVGEKYDPHRHQAMTMVDAPQTPNTVVQVFQKGYLLNDRVLRPALVSVAKAVDGDV